MSFDSIQAPQFHVELALRLSLVRLLYSAGMQRATSGKSGSETASQLQGRTAREFSRNSLEKTIEITVCIQSILTQSFGSQDYYKKSQMIMIGLARVSLFANDQA